MGSYLIVRRIPTNIVYLRTFSRATYRYQLRILDENNRLILVKPDARFTVRINATQGNLT